jgi:hypothetical protein
LIEADNEQSVCAPSHIRTGLQHYHNRRASLDLVCVAFVCLFLPYMFIYQLVQKGGSNVINRSCGLPLSCVGARQQSLPLEALL